MGPILLPSKPAIKAPKIHMLDYGGQLVAAQGGLTQTLLRIGTRHAVDYEMPTMESDPYGRIWSAKLRMAKLYGALFPYWQDGFDVGTPGAIVVDGGGQSGTSLRVKLGTPYYTVSFGQAFSMIHASRRYLYFAAEETLLDANGGALLPIFPMLRTLTTDLDVCEFGVPMIQGSLSGNEVAWQVRAEPLTDIGTFTITEDA